MQDRAIAEIGKLEFEKDKDLKPYQLFTQEPYPNKVCEVLLIVFEMKGEDFHYKTIDIQKAGEKNYYKYAYRKGSPRGGDITFTTKCSADLDKKLNTLLNNQFPKFLELAEKTNLDEFQIFKRLSICFHKERDDIQSAIQKKYENLPKDAQKVSIFSISLIIDGSERLLSDFETVRKQLELDGIEGNYKKYGVVSKGKNASCSICHENRENVFGFGTPFKYSTVDKPSFVAGFFDQKQNWVNYPICESCALEMELGKNYMYKNLVKYFYGQSYFLIPKTVIPGDLESLNTALEIIKDIDYRFKGGKAESAAAYEDFLMKDLGKVAKNIFTLNLLFYEENSTTKAIKIKLLLEEIPPSRFRKLFIEVPNKVNNHPLFKNALYYSKQKQYYDLKFSFSLIKQFFDDDFYEMVYKIFKGRKVSSYDLYNSFMKQIIINRNKKAEGKSYESFQVTIKKAFLIKSYLKELELIDKN